MTADTIWGRLAECVLHLDEPFRASEIIGWFRRHYPDVNEQSLRAHVQGATSNATPESRGAFANRTPLITRIDHGVYRRYSDDDLGHAPEPQRLEPTRAFNGPVPTRKPAATASSEEWHREANVQGAVVRHLALNGWTVLSVANTATKEHGIDVIASRDDVTVGVEAKGYPSKFYVTGDHAGEQKPTQPPTQARAWFDSAVVAALRLRTAQPTLSSVIALPDFPTYRRLAAGIAWALDRCEVHIWWVGADGTVQPS